MKKTKILLSWCHSDCTYSLLKILEKIPNIEIYIPSKVIPEFISFQLNYKEWPINEFKEKIKPLESLKDIHEIDYFFAEIVDVKWLKNNQFTDIQVEWGVKNLGVKKVIVYCYNIITFEKFKYKDKIPLITTSKMSFDTYGTAPKIFFYGEPQILPYKKPKKYKSMFLIQNSYEIQKNSIPIFKEIYNDYFFSKYDIRYYGYTEDLDLKKINYCHGKRLDRKKINKLIINKMTFSLHLKDHEGYGYHPLKCILAGRPVINFNKNIKGMTYDDYLIDGITAIRVDSIEELKAKLNELNSKEKINNFCQKCADFAKDYFNFEQENTKTANFLRKIFQR